MVDCDIYWLVGDDTVFVCLFVFGASAPSGSGPSHSRGF